MNYMKKIFKRFKNKKIALLGLGAESLAILEFFIEHKIGAQFTVCDARQNVRKIYDLSFAGSNVEWILGDDYDENLSEFDIIVRAPGYPLFNPNIKKAIEAGVEVTSATKLFFELSPTKNIIGVTGTKGKGTVSGLIFEILKEAGKDVYWGGNIGIPIFSFFDKLNSKSVVVLEMSSFQLEDMDVSPHIAVVTNFTKEHLAPADPNNPNFHKNMVVYKAIKQNIYKFQTNKDFAVLNNSLDKEEWKIGSGKKIFVHKSDMASQLVGEHNKENIALAVEVAKILKIKSKAVHTAVENFQGLPHRIEFAGEYKGILFYDDSFATTPESAMTAMKSFERPIVLLAGGADKGSSFNKMAKMIKKKVKYVILFKGEGSDRLRKELIRIDYPPTQIEVLDSMKKAVSISKQKAIKGDIVLLSTGCASFGVFKNYKERGDLFKKEV
jgi:UDP-N-acetylmuramoylalanine--D-glutamate ligase